jgi:hypothetical protein
MRLQSIRVPAGPGGWSAKHPRPVWPKSYRVRLDSLRLQPSRTAQGARRQRRSWAVSPKRNSEGGSDRSKSATGVRQDTNIAVEKSKPLRDSREAARSPPAYDIYHLQYLQEFIGAPTVLQAASERKKLIKIGSSEGRWICHMVFIIADLPRS